MKEEIQIEYFIDKGNFGTEREIYFGMSREHLLNLLGESKWVQKNRKAISPSIYKYDKVEFYFENDINGRLYGIQIIPGIESVPKLNLKINYNFIHSKLKYKEAIDHLDMKSIPYKFIKYKYDEIGSPDRIITSGNVELIFDDSFIIEKISKFIIFDQE